MHAKELIRIQLIVPFAQPLSADTAQLDAATRQLYVPFLDALERTENMRLAVHLGGHVLDYFARHQERLLLRLKALVKRGQIEILGGPFYGCIPALLPESDLRGQIQMASEFWDSYVGCVPQGFWLPNLSVTKELPRLLHDTGLRYGFVSDTQLQLAPGEKRLPAVGSLERGGHALGMFVLHQELSDALVHLQPEAWLAQAAAAGGPRPRRLLSVWAPAEVLGALLQAKDGGPNVLEAWFAPLSDGTRFVPVLPEDAFSTARPTARLRLGNVRAPELRHLQARDPVADWADYPYLFAEVDTLWRRMLRASGRLRQGIATMEDEGLEESWSDKLATAQRLIFAAQSPDAYWRGIKAGFCDPALREATLARVVQAELIVDKLLHGSKSAGWLGVQQADCDGDLAEEIFVSTPHVLAWLVPARGGDVRSLDDRGRSRNLLDAGSRRAEPFFSALQGGPSAAVGRGAPAARQGGKKLPLAADAVARCGIRHWVVERDVTPHALLTGAAPDLKPPHIGWDLLHRGIDANGRGFTLAQIGGFALKGPGRRQFEMQRETRVPADGPRVVMASRLALSGGEPVRWALEIPVRLGGRGLRLWVDDHEAELTQHAFENVRQVRLETDDGERVSLGITGEDGQAVELWCLPLVTTVQDQHGYTAVPQGIVLMPTLVLQGEASVRVHLGGTAQDHH
jgi:hypothetical protein